jgi:hypothetical protein
VPAPNNPHAASAGWIKYFDSYGSSASLMRDVGEGSVVRKTTIAIIGLSSVLVLSNLYWIYTLLDAGVSYTYLEDSYRHAQSTAEQALALLPEVARSTATRQSIIDAAVRARPGVQPFEKDGYLWIDELGLQFDASGRLTDVRTSIDPFVDSTGGETQ